MSRNLYDPTNDTLTPIGGYQSVDPELSTTSENPLQNKVVTSQIQTLTNQVSTLNTKATDKVLYLTGIACSATTGNFVSYSNSAITADHVLAECVFANPSAITTDVTWTTASGSLVLNGTCSTATTVNVVLVKKDN